jgi:hypothetical protein
MTELEVAKPNETVAEQELRTLAAFLFNLIEAQITRADTKAGLVIAADSVLITAALFQTPHSAILKVFDSSASFSQRGISLLMVLMFTTLLFSAMYGLLATRPNLRVKGGGETIFFFSRIAQYTHPEFLDVFSKLSSAEFHKAILTEVYNTARIANVKFARIRYSIDFLIASVILWTLIQLFIALSS